MKITKQHIACPKCSSSDAYCEYEDGHGYCFSCTYFKKGTGDDFGTVDVTYEYVPWRGITKETFEFYNSSTKVSESGEPLEVGFPYPNGRIKVRSRRDKDFRVAGALEHEQGYLFGMDKFPAGGKYLTITEGELDTMATFQMMGSKYPVVSINGASSAKKDCSKEYEYINSFDKIYLCLDNDEPGKKAASEIARLFDFNKVYVVKLRLKDANQYLTDVEASSEEFIRTWWNAKRFLPEGIISSYSEVDKILDEDLNKPSIPYPFPRLQEMTYGIRSGEVVLFTAMEGIGKTEIMRAIEYHLIKTTDENIGIIHLEESKGRMIKGLVGYEVQQPIHLPDRQIPNNEIKEIYKKLTKRDDRVHIYTHFGSDDPDSLVNAIRFMVGPCQCKRIFFDHITMAVTGLQNEDERRALDYMSTVLASMAEDLDYTLFEVSHVNDDGLTRGSRNISKVAHLHVHLDRDKEADTEEERNRTYLTVKKNRFAGKTGPAGVLYFDPQTFMIQQEVELPH